MNLTEKEKGARNMLVKLYNRAKTKATRQSRYDDLMVFERRMLAEGKNG